MHKFKDKILFFDCETSLLELYSHYIGSKVSIYHNQVKTSKRVICISYMAEGWSKPKSLQWNNGDDISMLIEFQNIASQYPILVAQNGDSFDIKVLNGRAWEEQIVPFKNVLSLDTLKMSRQNMRLTSHKLDYKLKILGDTGKDPMEFQDWIDVQNGDKKALKKMIKYCEKDVSGLREVFWSLLPYVNRLPTSLSVLLNGHKNGCEECGSLKITKNGTRPFAAGFKQRWRCTECNNDWTDTRLKKTTDRLGVGL